MELQHKLLILITSQKNVCTELEVLKQYIF
jgi:hypothetical protein